MICSRTAQKFHWLALLYVLLALLCREAEPFSPTSRSRITNSRIQQARASSSSSSSSSATDLELQFRALKVADVDPISSLLVDCFESDLQWFEFPERDARRKRYRDMLQKSFLRRVEEAENTSTDAKLSFMLLVEDNTKGNGKPIGFVQVGMLPPPPFFQPKENKKDDIVDSSPSQTTKDVPYIANLCVLPTYRKAGVGKKMVDICVRWLEKKTQRDTNGNVAVFENVFIAVDADNFVAKRFYEGNDFHWIEPPEMNPSRDYYYRRLIHSKKVES